MNTFDAYSQETDATLIAALEKAIEEFVKPFLEGIDGVEGVLVKSISETDDFDRIIDDPNAVEPDGINAGFAVGIAAAGLAFLLILILLIKRNNDNDEVSHLKLEEDANDETFIREFETTASNMSRDYETRNVHVVGEADSIISGWTGFNSREGMRAHEELEMPLGKLAHPQGDVHVCSSATCDVCEKRRQQFVQFIPTGTPPRPSSLPSDASREYVAEDTVEL